MFQKLKGAILSTLDSEPVQPKLRYKYTRPIFLGLDSDDELQVSSDTIIRPILVPRDLNKLKWNSGYAEAINAGKSARNEDQAAIYSSTLRTRYNKRTVLEKLMDMDPFLYHYFSKNMKSTTLPRMKSEHVLRLRSMVEPLSAADAVENRNATEPKSLPSTIDQQNSNSLSPSNQMLSDDLLSLSTPIPINPSHFDCTPSSSVASNSTDSLASFSSSTSNLGRSRSFRENLNDSRASLEKSQSFSSFLSSSSSGCVEMKHKTLPFHYFALFDGHAGSDVSVACSHQLHNIIAHKLQSIADLLIEFGIDNPTNQRVERQKSNDNKSLHTNRVKYNKSHLNTTSQPSVFDYALNDTANLFDYMTKVEISDTKENGNIEENLDENDDDAVNSEHATDGDMQQSDPQQPISSFNYKPNRNKLITVDSLIIGALESAFLEIDQIIAHDKKYYKMSGGCTSLVALFILGKLYVANAGDSRAIIVKDNQVIPMSFDFTPESERERIKYLGLLKPELLGNEFTALEFIRRPTRKDLGKKLLCRDGFMSGWVYKVVTIDDLKYPLVFGEGKRCRVLATIGVTRGIGDHELKANGNGDVRIINLEKDDTLNDNDVLIMGTDGLFDITSNEKAASICTNTFQHFPSDESKDEHQDKENKSNQLNFKYRYISLAQDLVCYARGKSKHNNGKNWKTSDDKQATIDDISVFVIPLKPYRDEYKEWQKTRDIVANHAVASNDKLVDTVANECVNNRPDSNNVQKNGNDSVQQLNVRNRHDQLHK